MNYNKGKRTVQIKLYCEFNKIFEMNENILTELGRIHPVKKVACPHCGYILPVDPPKNINNLNTICLKCKKRLMCICLILLGKLILLHSLGRIY